MNKKIWTTMGGLIGDTICALPTLLYFEKKYPGSYKIWPIERKVSFIAPLFLNHPLIDKIKISEGWGEFNGDSDKKLMSECDIVVDDARNDKHSSSDWFNNYNLVEETAHMHGIYDMKEVLTEDEMKPKLEKWFDVGIENTIQGTYSKNNDVKLNYFNKNIAIWPFTGNGKEAGRCPTKEWWQDLISKLILEGYTVFHYGLDSEPRLHNSNSYKKLTYMSFFQQIKAALASDFYIASSTGPVWVMGAYQHPGITLETYWLPGHYRNPSSVTPINKNSNVIFVEKNNLGVSKIKQDDVIKTIKKELI